MPGRDRQRKGRSARRLLAVAALGCTLAVISATGVADAGLQSRIDTAKQQALDLEGQIQARGDRIAGLEEQASEAQGRIEALAAQLHGGEQRSAELSAELGSAESSLRESRSRLRRAQAVLAERLIEIYKRGEPDYLELVLSSHGFDDLTTRAAYLKAVEDADARITGRVRNLSEQVKAEVDRISEVKSQLDEHNASLLSAARELAATRASLRDQAAELAGAKAQEARDLASIRATVRDLQTQLDSQQLAALFGNGSWAIPEYIVMCESGGNYHALNPTSGAGGAYQILPSTWSAYGGQGLPHEAPPAEQDSIAAQIWADSGPSAWSCA
ncbi:MAG: transglycosylase family protein [Solirubrobacterales bacterium]